MSTAEIQAAVSLVRDYPRSQFFFQIDSLMLRSMSQDPDSLLMMRYRDGDTRAFEDLYERYKGPLYRYFLRYGQDQRWAEELYQEVWIKIIRTRNRYKPLAKFSTYLYQLAHNCLIDHVRRQSRRPHLVSSENRQEPVDGEHSLEGTIAVTQAKHLFAKALAELPSEQREAFVLREESGLSLEQIAKVTGVGQETAKSRLRYANQKLKGLVSKIVGEIL